MDVSSTELGILGTLTPWWNNKVFLAVYNYYYIDDTGKGILKSLVRIMEGVM